MRANTLDATITIRTDASLRRAIDAAASREGASASDWVRRALAAIVGSDDPPTTPPPAAAAMRARLPVAA